MGGKDAEQKDQAKLTRASTWTDLIASSFLGSAIFV